MDQKRYYWLERAAFLLAIALVISRCLSSEFLRDPNEVMPNGPAIPRGPGAAVSVVMDVLFCIPALLVLFRQSLAGIRWKVGVAPALFLCWAVWAGVSISWAPDRFGAAVGAADLIAAGALLWAMAQMVHDWSHIRSIGVVCIGLLLSYLAYGVVYESMDLPELRSQWTQDVHGLRTKALEAHGWKEGSFAARQFEMKVLHGEINGFSTSPNTYAAMLVLLGIVAAGVVIESCRQRQKLPLNIALALMIIPVAWLIWKTQSKAAYVTPILAIIAFTLLAIFPRQIHRFRRWIYTAILIVFVLCSAYLVHYGTVHGNLHNDSMNFRWKYWVASSKLFEQHPVLGIGWNGFGDRYLAVRLPSASEEIKDPHDMFVRVFVELGLIGGVIFVGFLALAWWRMTGATGDEEKIGLEQESENVPVTGLMFAMLIAMIINALATIDFSQIQAFVFLEIIRRCIYLAMLLIAIAFVLSGNRKRIESLPSTWILLAMCIGLGMFLLHNLIDFSLFDPSPGPMMLFAMLVGAVIGMRSTAATKPKTGWLRSGAATVIFLAAIFCFALPIVQAENEAQQADDLVRANQPEEAVRLYRQATATIPYNSDYWLRQAKALAYSGASTADVEAAIHAAQSADPYSIPVYLLRAHYLSRLPNPDVPAIEAAYESALKLAPTEVSIRLEYARFLEQSNRNRMAAEEYEKSLWYNNQLPPEEPKRLPVEEVDRISKLILKLRAGN